MKTSRPSRYERVILLYFDYMMNELLLAAIFLDADPIQPSIPPCDGPNQMANEGDTLLSS